MNIPNLDGERILFVGAGGGFDIFAALPLAIERKFYFELANFGRSMDELVRPANEKDYPEGSLIEYNIWVLGRQGVINTRNSLQRLVDESGIDTIIAVDGGVDSLMRGNEKNSGTILEDFIVLAAIDEVKVKNKYLACVGFGSETEEELNHYCVLENMAALIQSGHFIGSCSLTKDMVEYKIYKLMCEKAWSKGRVSHIQSKVIAAIEGQFGDQQIERMDAQLASKKITPSFISPLMGIYWFFDLKGVVANNIVIPHIAKSRTFIDAKILLQQSLQINREKKGIPL